MSISHTHKRLYTHTDAYTYCTNLRLSIILKGDTVLLLFLFTGLQQRHLWLWSCKGYICVYCILYVVVSVIALILSKCHFSLLLCMSVSLLISWGVCSGLLNYKCGRQKGIPKTQWSADTCRLVISCLSSIAAPPSLPNTCPPYRMSFGKNPFAIKRLLPW